MQHSGAGGTGHAIGTDDYLLNIELLDQRHEPSRRMHARSRYVGSLECGVIVDERDETALRIDTQCRGELDSGAAGAIDHDALRRGRGIEGLLQQTAGGKPAEGKQHGAHREVYDGDGAWNARHAACLGHEDDHQPQRNRDRHGLSDGPQHGLGDVADHRAVKTELDEDRNCDRRRQRHDDDLRLVRDERTAEPQCIAQPQGEEQDKEIDAGKQQPLLPARHCDQPG